MKVGHFVPLAGYVIMLQDKIILKQKMKRALLVSLIITGFQFGCNRKPPASKQQTDSKPDKAQETIVELPPVQTQSSSESEFLGVDKKNGFRSLVFGQEMSVTEGFSIQKDGDTMQVATRNDDDLSFDGVPLKSIVYGSFRNKLYQVKISFEIEHAKKDGHFVNNYHELVGRDSNLSFPIIRSGDVATRIGRFIRDSYGLPNSEIIEILTTDTVFGNMEYGDKRMMLWTGDRIAITFSETNFYAYADMPPRTSGIIEIKSIGIDNEYKKYIEAVRSSRASGTPDGL